MTAMSFDRAQSVRLPECVRGAIVERIAAVLREAGPEKLVQMSERPEQFAECFIALAESVAEEKYKAGLTSMVENALFTVAERLRIPTPRNTAQSPA